MTQLERLRHKKAGQICANVVLITNSAANYHPSDNGKLFVAEQDLHTSFEVTRVTHGIGELLLEKISRWPIVRDLEI